MEQLAIAFIGLVAFSISHFTITIWLLYDTRKKLKKLLKEDK